MITARKWVAVDFGGPEVLRSIEVEVPDPEPGQVTIDVRAAGLNPADAKHIAPGQDRTLLPLSVGYEVAGVVTAFGPDTELASGGGAAGDQVVALVADRSRVVTIAAAPRAKAEGYVFVGVSNPASGPFRARARNRILKLAQDGDLVVSMAGTFKFDDAPAAFAVLTSRHRPGKLALVSEGWGPALGGGLR